MPAPATTVQTKGPDEEKIKKILERTGYTLDVTTGKIFLVSRGLMFLAGLTVFVTHTQVKENMVVRRRIGKATHPAMDVKCFVAKYQKTCSKMNSYRCSKNAVRYGI